MPLSLNRIKSFVACSCAVLIFSAANAQKVEMFSLAVPSYKVSNSLYNKITVIDMRPDTSNYGLIQKGLSNKKAMLISDTPLSQQTENLLAAIIDNSGKSSDLVMIIKRFSFSEMTLSFSEKGYFNLIASLHAKQGQGYQRIAAIDTSVIISAMDVTNAILKKGSSVFADFIANNLTKVPAGDILTYADMIKDDGADKERMPVYYTDSYIDGVYKNYEAFLKQIPSGNILVEGDSISKKTVKSLFTDGKFRKVDPTKVYAIVVYGKPYIATKYGYYPLKKANGIFSFIARVPTASSTDMVVASVALGLAGSLIASGANNVLEIRIDRYTGDFIKLRQAGEWELNSNK